MLLRDDYNIRIPEGISFDPKEKPQIRWVHSLRLPFRLRLGGTFRFQPPEKKHVIIVLNQQLIPSPDPLNDVDERTKASEVMIIVDRRAIHKEIQEYEKTHVGWSSAHVELVASVDYAARNFNEFLVAYKMVATQESVNGAKSLRFVGQQDFIESDMMPCSWRVNSTDGHALSDAELQSLSDKGIRFGGGSIRASGPLHDLSGDIQEKLSTSYRTSHDEVSYHFKFVSEMAYASGDFTTSLLMACAALEAIHCSFLVKRSLRDGCPEPDASQIVGDALMGSFSNMLPFTVWSMEENKRLAELLIAAKEAISARNDIMHAIRIKGKKRGPEYFKIKMLSNIDMQQYVKSLFGLIKEFQKAISSLDAQN